MALDRRNKKNMRLIVEGSTEWEWFDIYIDFSGNREYLMPHRPNILLFNLLRGGVTLGELERNMWKMVSDVSLSGKRFKKGQTNPRLKYRKNQARKLENSVGHLINVVNEYIEYAA